MSYKNAMAGLNLGGGKAVSYETLKGEFDRAALFIAVYGKVYRGAGGALCIRQKMWG